jgi:hypothetical protein
MTNQAGAPSIEQRLERLERSQSRSRAALVMLATLSLVLFGWQFLPASPLIEARQIVLRDARHRSRAELTTWADGSVVFRLNGLDEKAHGLWMLLPNGAMTLRLSDSSGYSRAEVRLEPDGEPSVVLAGSDGRTRTRLGVFADGGTPAVIVRNARNEPSWQAP